MGLVIKCFKELQHGINIKKYNLLGGAARGWCVEILNFFHPQTH